ncbi:MAG: hypothetical protein LBH70_04320 [Spirochaetaceae bacterium]|jgi:hypothetical protein|nr:hypothetical protein [Spirochaetaceae bacterium]
MTEIPKEDRMSHSAIEHFRKKINNKAYLNEAIQRIAVVLCNELLDIPHGGLVHGRQRKKRK